MATTSDKKEKIFDAQFHSSWPKIFVTCGLKNIKFWSLCGNFLTPKSGEFGGGGGARSDGGAGGGGGESQTLLCLAFGENKITFSGALNGSIFLFREEKIEGIHEFAHKGGVFCMKKIENGFATGGRDGQIRIWDENFKPKNWISIEKFVWIFDEFWIRGLSFSSKNEKILIGTHNSNIYEINLRNPDEKPKVVTSGHWEGELWALAVDPKGDLIATGGDDQNLRFWSPKNFQLINVKILENKIRCCAFNQDGTKIAAGLSNGQLVIFDVKNLNELTKIRQNSRPIQELIFSPDGQILASGSDDGTANFYKVKENFQKFGSILVNNKQSITHMDWSTDGKILRIDTDGGEFFYSVSG